MKVLIIRLSAMGDIIHGLPAVALLKDRIPDLELTWLVEPAGFPLLAGNPAVDRVIVFPKRKWLQQLRSVSGFGATAAEANTFISNLRRLKFHAAFDFQGLLKSSLLGFLSGANLRFGFKGTREGAERLLTHALDVGDYFAYDTHVVDLNLQLAEYACSVLLGEPSDRPPHMDDAKYRSYICMRLGFPLPTPPAETSRRNRELLLAGQAQEPAPLMAFIPGTTWETKIWESHNWTELANMCLSKFGGRLLMLGGPSEVEMNSQIVAGLPPDLAARVMNLTNRTEIEDLIAIFQMTDIVVGADTGPLHLAAAVGKSKVLAVFGSTPPYRNGPYGDLCRFVNLNLECQPCFQKICPLGTIACLKDLPVEHVFSKLLELV